VDDKRFDEFVKQVGAGSEARRSFVKRALGGALAGLVALRGGKAGAQPGCRREGHPCEGNQDCCPGLECRVTGPGDAKRCATPRTTTKRPTTTTKKPTTTTKKPTTTTKRPRH
jgi:hypothetical protein